MKINSSEKGQALIIITFAAIVLFGFAALAIDGSMAFSDKRHAQNAADTAALDAALSKTRGGSWEQEGLDRANSNGYDDTQTAVYNPPMDGNYAGNNEYVQVKITSHVKTVFARVIGFEQLTNKVEAVARSVPGTISPMFAGNAVVSLAPSECHAVTYQGNADTTIQGGGIFVNSDCASAAFFNHSSSAQLTAPCLQSVGAIQAQTGVLNIPSSCIQSGPPEVSAFNYPPDNIVFPNIVCPSGESQDGNTLNPGTYTSGNKFPPNGVTHLNGGTYCVYNDFSVQGGDAVIGHDVIIIMMDGDVTFNGGATIELSGPAGPQTAENPYGGLFLYMPMSNSGTISINGNSESGFTGTVLAPAADVTINGTGDNGLHGQIIGYTVDISGTSDTSIVYDADENWDAPVPPLVELTQ